jgi:vacuolar-type H+-ATPase subunit H
MRDEMSLREVEPELGAIDAYALGGDEPPFPLVIRGYDRRSVDDYLDATGARLAELEALQSPSTAVKQALERVADDTGGILKQAHETADEVVRRAREEADRTIREARDEADRTISSAQARARQLAIDTDALWQERMRLIDDAHATGAALIEIADTAAGRFPAEEEAPEAASEGVVVAEPMDGALEPEEDEVEQPTEAIDVSAIWAAEDAAEADMTAGAVEARASAEAEAVSDEAGGERLPDGLDDLEPPPEFR